MYNIVQNTYNLRQFMPIFLFLNVMRKSECLNISQKEFWKNGCKKLKCELRINLYRNVNLKPQNFVIYKKKKISK